ncbi:MAG: hypothetical protein KGS72_04275 [Cyanobacteria bacterium REEB67]|nr:hypothetical protein [Cyanobacteria bacterium REEB67]
MSVLFSDDLPADNESLRRRIFQGEIFLLPAGAASLCLCDALLQIASDNILGEKQTVTAGNRQVVAAALRAAPGRSGEEGARAGHAIVKEALLAEPTFDELLLAVLDECGFERQEVLFDPLRMRISYDGGYKEEINRRSNSVHRDTWYANSQSQINFWMPLHDVSAADAFSFYLKNFASAVPNTSEQFDYDLWMKTTGWQSSMILSTFPTADADPRSLGERTSFSARAGQLLLFSASHLHQTNPNDSGLARYSVDFRIVHRADLASGLAAPNVDNLSQGDATRDYRKNSDDV